MIKVNPKTNKVTESGRLVIPSIPKERDSNYGVNGDFRINSLKEVDSLSRPRIGPRIRIVSVTRARAVNFRPAPISLEVYNKNFRNNLDELAKSRIERLIRLDWLFENTSVKKFPFLKSYSRKVLSFFYDRKLEVTFFNETDDDGILIEVHSINFVYVVELFPNHQFVFLRTESNGENAVGCEDDFSKFDEYAPQVFGA